MADWTDKSRAALIKAYEDAKPTPENSMEIVAKIAPDFDATPNGARAILSKANVYIKKTPAKSSASKGAASGEKKETKAESLERLSNSIDALGLEPDDTVISKLTGKAAAYFADVITKATSEDEE